MALHGRRENRMIRATWEEVVMPRASGRWVPLSPARRFIADLVHFAQKVPLCTMQRTMNVARAAAERVRCSPRPGWCALFLKAYGIVAARRPQLRQAYMPWPWAHLYEHPESIASVTIERRVGDEDVVFMAHVHGPQNQTLATLQEHLIRFKTAPINSISMFRRIVKTSRLPRPLRRLLWWFGLNGSGDRRARHLGTWGVSVTAGFGAVGLRPLSPLTTNLGYGLVGDDGSVDVRITYDHRVLDGGTAARALADVEEALNGPILAELKGIAEAAAA